MERSLWQRRLLNVPGSTQSADSTMRNIRITSVGIVAAIIVMGAVSAGAAEQSIYEATLLDKNILPTSSALSKYLRELHPDKEQLERVKRLIQQLGASGS